MDLSKIISYILISEGGESCKIVMCDGTVNYRYIEIGTTYEEIEKMIEEELEYI